MIQQLPKHEKKRDVVFDVFSHVFAVFRRLSRCFLAVVVVVVVEVVVVAVVVVVVVVVAVHGRWLPSSWWSEMSRLSSYGGP